MKTIEEILHSLQQLIALGAYEQFETDTLEIKPGPSDSGSWKEIYKSVNAFLNTRGGILLLGVKEEGQGDSRRYVFRGWSENLENNLKGIAKLFTDRSGKEVDLTEQIRPPEIKNFATGQVALLYVDELAADRKYVFLQRAAYKRFATGDVKLTDPEISAQEEYRQESIQARELAIVPGTSLESIDLDILNKYISQLNRQYKIETLKSSAEAALPFLTRKHFVRDGSVTTLGMLVCGDHPADHLGFRCHLHGYVDMARRIAEDKQDFVDNILPLMEFGYTYVLRNIHVGVSYEKGGTAKPQYPDELLRETVNNALAHRDYSINKQVVIAIKPGQQISIRNPGGFREHLLIVKTEEPVPVRRIIPEAKPRNPKLADVLRVYRKWEGRGIGMATMVNLCLENAIDLPFYQFYTEEVQLVLRAGKLLDERMERLFHSYDGYLEEKLRGNPLNEAQKLVLAYLIKSEWDNRRSRYTILLTADNNHFDEIRALETAQLIVKHAASTEIHPVYVADRVLLATDFLTQLRDVFGPGFDPLPVPTKDILSTVYRYNHFSRSAHPSAKQVAFSLWHERHSTAEGDIREFDRFYRKIRYIFNSLQKEGFVTKKDKGYQINMSFKDDRLF